MRSKQQRFQIFIERLHAAQPARSAGEIVALLAAILNAVEDEYSGVPSNPQLWQSDGRMHPPHEDSRRSVSGHPALARYRSRAHNTFVGENGSIRIETLEGKVFLDKAGLDERTIHDLNE